MSKLQQMLCLKGCKNLILQMKQSKKKSKSMGVLLCL